MPVGRYGSQRDTAPRTPDGVLPPDRPTALPPVGRLLGVDWGEKRVGLALSDPAQIVAHPLGTLVRRQGKRFPMQALRRQLDAHHPVGVVVGLPLDSEGVEGPAARAACETGRLIARTTGLPVHYVDERMTTARALAAVRELGGRVRGREAEVDALAATVLLQGFLEQRRP